MTTENTENAADKLRYEVFAVGDKLYCLWGWNIVEMNCDFLNTIDHEYFTYVADVHHAALAGPHKFRAAVALQTAYFHGLELLFSLIFAGLQAPNAVPAWILKYRIEDLRNLVRGVNRGAIDITARMKLGQYSWQAISDLIHAVVFPNDKEQQRLADDVAKLWSLFGRDYVHEAHIDVT
jgi:hypothetical protein